MGQPPAIDSTPGGASGDPGSGVPERVDVFVSYNSRDHIPVVELAEGLAGLGLKPFLDRWDLAPGQRWRPELERVLARCGAVLVVLGPHGVGEVQEREIDVALRRQDKDRHFPVIPVLLAGSEPPGGMLAALTWVDIRHQATSEAVSDLARAIRRQWDQEASTARARTNRRRYLANLVLLLVALGVGLAWYSRHLAERMESVAFGGSVTLPAVVWLVFLYLRWGAEDEVKNLPRRLFGSAQSTRGLVGLLVLVLGLLGATSSVQVVRSARADAGEAPRVVVRSEGGEPSWTSPPLTVERPVVSRMFFFRFGSPIELRLKPAGDRGPISVRLGPASRVVVHVPDQFGPRPVEVVRLLPGAHLVRALGKPGIEVNRRYELRVIGAGVTQRVTDLRRQAVYLAESAADIETGWEREPAGERGARYRGWARTRLGLPEDQVEMFLASWEGRRTVTGWLAPVNLEGVVFQLVPEGEAAPERLTSVVWDGTNGIRTVLIDRVP